VRLSAGKREFASYVGREAGQPQELQHRGLQEKRERLPLGRHSPLEEDPRLNAYAKHRSSRNEPLPEVAGIRSTPSWRRPALAEAVRFRNRLIAHVDDRYRR